MVFDCAARSQGVCLNDLLKKGPNLTNSLLGVLCRFREGPVGLTCDVKSMFHRVHVPEPDRDLLRFLWFCGDGLQGEIEVWKMRSHVFGAVSSSSVASFALNFCAEEGRSAYPEAALGRLRKTCVDDALCATESAEKASVDRLTLAGSDARRGTPRAATGSASLRFFKCRRQTIIARNNF